MTSISDFMAYAEYAMWNNRVPKEQREAVIRSLYNLFDMYTPDQMTEMLNEDLQKYGDS